MFRRFFISLSVALACLAVVLLAAWINFLLTPIVTEPAGLRYQLRAGANFKSFSENLDQLGIVKAPFFFKLLARIRGNTHELKAGIYLIPKGATPSQFLDQVTTGSGLLYHSFAIIPGWSFQQLRAALHQDAGIEHSIDKWSDSEVMQQVAKSKLSPEGQFFADTYYYAEGTSDLKLLNRAFKRMQTKSEQAWASRDPRLPYKTFYEALIAASLVEKEAHLSSERPVIAGVLVNRLQRKMLLQFDPTVLYGLAQWERSHLTTGYRGIIRKRDLKLDTPYNTYLHRGLPPTPIAIPSLDSIVATLHPVQHAYLYFVATGSGGHQFSQTLSEHNLAVMIQRYRDQGFYNYMFIKAYLLKRLSGVSSPA